MTFIRSERYAAGILLAAAVAGLVLANTPLGLALIALADEPRDLSLFALDLSLRHWISDGLLVVFFFLIAVELKRELVIGDLNSISKAALPAFAAFGGVAVPAGIYLWVVAASGAKGELVAGWPVPTATDIAFALGVLAVFGRGIPTRVRVFLLALAVLDDLVAILIIAVFFTSDIQLQFLGCAAVTATGFGLLSGMLKPRSRWIRARRAQWPVVGALIVLGMLTWYFTLQSGVHATIAGVMLGLVMARVPAGRTHHLLEPYSNGVVLPLFAFSAAMVTIPVVPVDEFSPAFWGIVIALPMGKFAGITVAGLLGSRIAARREQTALKLPDIIVVACLGGVGFTVSLLMSELAFSGERGIADQGILAVLLGSGVAMVVAAFVVSARARTYRGLLPQR
jgi:NhaA family Na+:H+ antiporter